MRYKTNDLLTNLHLAAWALVMEEDPEGTVHFRPDVYGRDAPVAEALERTPPGAELPSRSVRGPFGS